MSTSGWKKSACGERTEGEPKVEPMIRALRNLSFRTQSKLYNKIIVYNPKKNTKKISRKDPLFFLSDRRIDYIPAASVTHRLDFQRLKILQYLNISSPEQQLRIEDKMFDPPEAVRGMTKLDTSKFEKVVEVACVRVPVIHIQSFKGILNTFKLKMPNLSPVVDLHRSDPDFKKYKLLLLNPLLIPEDFQENYKLEEKQATMQAYDLKMTYSNWDFNDIVTAILPVDHKVSGFSTVGHIAHFNLREASLPYKHVIGEALLDKLANIKTVVNKLDVIDNTYRNFQMEVIAGEENLVTQTKENGCTFELDFSKVYWNSRLGTEHTRIVKMVREGDLLLDVFAGIGPFAIPAAKKKAEVYANDLNPASYESLMRNVELNKVQGRIHCYNLDGREFIQTVVKEQLCRFYSEKEDSIYTHPLSIHIVMNLPALAVTFLDAFKSLLADIPEDVEIKPESLPNVHCYCFTDMEEAEAKWNRDKSVELKQRVIQVFGLPDIDDVTLRFVRDVAPNKEMMCARFKLTPGILRGKSDPGKVLVSEEIEEEHRDEPPRKVMKTAE